MDSDMRPHRNCGSARRWARRQKRRNAPPFQSLEVVSWNCAGLTLYKLFLLLEYTRADIICLQETWLPTGGTFPDIPGYTVLEHRRPKGKRGGIAVLVRQGLNWTLVHTCEYAQVLKLGLPDQQEAFVVNVYLPPAASLARKGVTPA